MRYHLPEEEKVTTSNKDNCWAPFDCDPLDILQDDFGDGYADLYDYYGESADNYMISTNTYGGKMSIGCNDDHAQEV